MGSTPRGVRVGRERAGTGAKDDATARLVIELHHALSDHEWVVVRQRNDAGAELDSMGALRGGGQEDLRRRDHLPAGGVMLAAPEFVVSQMFEVFDECKITLNLEHRLLTDRMMWCEERTETQICHFSLPVGGIEQVRTTVIDARRRHNEVRQGRPAPRCGPAFASCSAPVPLASARLSTIFAQKSSGTVRRRRTKRIRSGAMAQSFQFETQIAFEQAGVKFNVTLGGAAGEAAAFELTVDDLVTGDRVAFNHEACPAVHDFTRGYTRWLGTRGVRADRGDADVTGITREGLSSAQMLQPGPDAVDMIDQKFSNYTDSVIEANGYSDVIYEKGDGVARLMINRPETFNAKRGITMEEMADALLDASQDNSVRAAVISGAGPNGFCTGNDQSYDPSLERDDYSGTATVSYSQVIQQMPQPVIAAVDGYAIGSGNILAYESDFTIATTRSRFGQTGPRVGSPAAGHGVAMLAARVGQKRAREI